MLKITAFYWRYGIFSKSVVAASGTSPIWAVGRRLIGSRRVRRICMDLLRERSARHWARAAAGAAPIGLAGCGGAPSQNILGSYFPSWMLCVLAGIGAAILVRQGLVAAGIDKLLPAPLLVYLAFTVFFAFVAWLVWLG